MSSVSTGACISSDAMFSAFSRTLSAATRVAEAVITVAREACAPMPCSIRSVWPWMTRIFVMSARGISRATRPVTVHAARGSAMDNRHLGHGGAEHFGADLRHHRLEPLADRTPAGDDLDL